MALRKFLYIDAEGIATEAVLGSDELQLSALTIASAGDITVSGGGELVGLPAVPTGGTAATSKDYVDSVVNNLTRKQSCRVRSDTEVDNTWASLGSGVGKTITAPTNAISFNTIDGVLLSLNDRVCLADYNGTPSPTTTTSVENGIYEVTALGDAATTSFELTRTVDADQDSEVNSGMTVFCYEGTVFGDTQWTVVTNDPITVDTTPIQFTITAGPGLFVGGDGIDITGSTISVDLATVSGLEFDGGSPNKLRVDADGNRAIAIDATGVYVEIAAAGAGTGGIEFDGSGDLQVDLTALPGLELTATGLQAKTDGVTIQINGSGELEVIGAGDANRISNSFAVNAATVIGDAVQWSTTNDRVTPSDAAISATGLQKAFGIAETAQPTPGSNATIVSHGVATGVISTATAGDRYYLQATGGIGTALPAGNASIIMVGYAKNADDLFVDVNILGKKVA